MDSIAKIMTVSYGTFSCKLEGFDDPFTTMQLVAEYFRKLAAEDRFFGGEPLQPDTDTLHRIAADANSNQIDAEVDETGIVLRQATVVDVKPAAPSVTAQQSTERTKPAPANDFPTFASKRNAAEPAPQKTARKIIPPSKTPVVADETLIEPTVFSSRRSALEPNENEPRLPAAEILRNEDQEEAPAAKELVKQTDVKQAVKKVAAAIAEDIAPQKDTTHQKQGAPKKEAHELNEIQQEDAALDRLLETTNSKLAKPAHARRSNALERLKAAVAATEAERRLRGITSPGRPKVQDLSSEADNFRHELRSVRVSHEEAIKITRPVAKRSENSRRRSPIATLILGSEQQVAEANTDVSENLKKKPVHEEITPKTENTTLKVVRPAPETGNFARFAAKAGAGTLLELLEASAAYLAIVENQPRFSQERLVANLEGYLQGNSVSAEATNRSLNRLLRDGKILRVKTDRFTISKSTRHGYQEKLAG